MRALAQRPGNQGGYDYADVDEDVEDLERHRSAEIVGAVERTDLARDITFEGADPEQQENQRKDERRLDRHQKMADRHQHAADDESRVPTEPAVGDDAPEDRGEIDERG